MLLIQSVIRLPVHDRKGVKNIPMMISEQHNEAPFAFNHHGLSAKLTDKSKLNNETF